MSSGSVFSAISQNGLFAVGAGGVHNPGLRDNLISNQGKGTMISFFYETSV